MSERTHSIPSQSTCELSVRGGQLFCKTAGMDEATEAKIVYLRPLTTRREVAVLGKEDQELCYLNSVEELAEPSRVIAAEQLAARYHLPEIKRVESIETLFGTHYWTVETATGKHEFAFKEPGKNVTSMPNGRLVLRDTIGNRYTIPSIEALDLHSRRQVRKII